MRRAAVLFWLLLWLVVACDATPALTPTPARRAAAPAAPDWTPDDAVGALRRWLRACSAQPDEVVAPVVRVWPPPEHPDAEFARAEPPPVPAGMRWPPGAWLVATPTGRWWIKPPEAPVALDAASRAGNSCATVAEDASTAPPERAQRP